MVRIEALLRQYGKETECDPPGSIEAKVLDRVRAKAESPISTWLGGAWFRPAAMAAGLAMGLLSIALPPFTANAKSTVPELAMFAPDAPHLLSTWLDQTK